MVKDTSRSEDSQMFKGEDIRGNEYDLFTRIYYFRHEVREEGSTNDSSIDIRAN